jgi:RecA-family ATPase
MAVAEGRSWLGFEALPPARVLYINFEVADEEFKVRVDQVAPALGTSRKALKGKMDFIHLKGRPSGLGKLAAALRRLRNPKSPWELIIIDPVYRLLMAGVRLEGEDQSSDNIENNNTLIYALFCSLEELAAEFNTAIFAVHHFKKGPAGRRRSSIRGREVGCLDGLLT